jgi:hypothetical protein
MLVMCYPVSQILTDVKSSAQETYKILWYDHIDGFIQLTQYGADLTHTVGAIVEQE